MGEVDWISRYIAPLVTQPGAAKLQDDVALLDTKGVVIATMDTLVEGVHFLPDDPLETVGQKLVRVNVSDIHAIGLIRDEKLMREIRVAVKDMQDIANRGVDGKLHALLAVHR